MLTATGHAEHEIHGTETILLVEDEGALQKLIARALRNLGYTVHAFEHPRTAIDFSRAYAGPIHLLAADVILPEMNGKRMASEVVRRHQESHVLFMSGSGADVLGRNGSIEPEANFLPKPFTLARLAEKVREVLDCARA